MNEIHRAGANALVYSYCRANGVCTSCRRKYVERGLVTCAVCIAKNKRLNRVYRERAKAKG